MTDMSSMESKPGVILLRSISARTEGRSQWSNGRIAHISDDRAPCIETYREGCRCDLCCLKFKRWRAERTRRVNAALRKLREERENRGRRGRLKVGTVTGQQIIGARKRWTRGQQLINAGRDERDAVVRDLRAKGMSWHAIGVTLDISSVTAQQMAKRPVRGRGTSL